MADENTRADAVRAYLSGAGVDGGAQADPNAALGNFRSSSEVVSLDFVVSGPIANVTVGFLSGANGPGSGVLAATGADALAWTPPGGTPGPAVTILNGETKVLEGGGGTGADRFIRVSRTSAVALSGAATLTLSDRFNNLPGFDNVSSAEALAGDGEYRALILKNGSAGSVTLLRVFVRTLGTRRTSNTSQLPLAGAGTIGTSGSFADWPSAGFAHVKTSGGVIREVVYYESRTDTVLTVPTAGRAMLGTTAAAGAATDTVDAVPGVRIALEAPSSQPAGSVQTIANEGTSPTGRTWKLGLAGDGAADQVDIGTLTAGQIQGLWVHRQVPAGMKAAGSVLQSVGLSFDA